MKLSADDKESVGLGAVSLAEVLAQNHPHTGSDQHVTAETLIQTPQGVFHVVMTLSPPDSYEWWERTLKERAQRQVDVFADTGLGETNET